MRGSLLRSIIAEQKKEPEMTVRYYISSADLTAEKFATAIRNHWHVENKLHWRLDVVMNEDDCKIRRGNAAELFSGIRHIAINILTNDKVFKAGLRRKMRKAAMDRNYLASVLAGSGLSLSCPALTVNRTTGQNFYGTECGWRRRAGRRDRQPVYLQGPGEL